MEELKVEALTDKQVGAVLRKLARNCDSMQWAVAWATPNEVGATAFENRSKFQHFVIGTHFFQTSPDFLEEFKNLKSARMMLPTGATFHPKVYLFRTGDRASAVVGSHNLTRAAFATNTEAALLIEGPSASPALAKLSTFVKTEWLRAKPISEHLYRYRVQHLAREDALRELEDYDEKLTVRAPRRGSNTRPLEWTWDEFLRQVRAPRPNKLKLEGRLPVLEGARAIFEARRSFSRLTPLERKAVTGTFDKKELRLEGKNWAWFGSMVGHGDFRHRVNGDTPNPHLAAAVDAIPLTGEVKEAHYRKFVLHLKRAFKDATHQADYAIATRLLAIKRPDRFVGINSRNERTLCPAFGITRAHLNVDTYWELVAVPITQTRWWRSPPPAKGLALQIWQGRAALLDCIYYRPAPGDTV